MAFSIPIRHRPATDTRGVGGGWLRSLANLWHEHQARTQLARLDDRMLSDLGLTRGDLDHQLARPLWQSIDGGELDAQRRRNTRRSGWDGPIGR